MNLHLNKEAGTLTTNATYSIRFKRNMVRGFDGNEWSHCLITTRHLIRFTLTLSRQQDNKFQIDTEDRQVD